MHHLSGHSLQFIVIVIIKTSVLLNRVLGKKWRYIACICCEAPIIYRPITKSATFFLVPDFINSVILQYYGEYGQCMTLKMCVRKFCIRYILNKQFVLNISRGIYHKVSDGNLLIWLSVYH